MGNKEKITITNDNNRLSPEDIERMINDAEKFAEEDAALKGKVEARNELESYAYSLKNQIGDKEKLGGKLSEDEESKIEEVINEKIKWLEEIPEAEAEDFKAQKKEMEDIVQPIIAKLYQGQGGAPPGDEGDEDDELKDELLSTRSPLTNLCPTSKTLDPQLREVVDDRHQDDHLVIKVGSLSQGCISKTRPSVDMMLSRCQSRKL